ncbi:MAG: methyl-accepting chemotaxis protein [Deltaproteobacteria bacterium]|jgi:methyl-accepting chemotaxis protein|nr:methyl-accepting chemotaxis protein [Deltaproteobacteria bacterium]
MTTKYRVIIGFLLMICLLIAVTIMSYLKLHEASDGFAVYRIQARTAVASNAAFSRVRGMQDQFSRFRLNLDEAHIKEANRLMDRALNTYLAKAKSLENDPKEQAVLDTQIAQIKQIMQLSEVMQQKLSTATSQVDGPLTQLGQAIDDSLSEMSEGAHKVNNISLLTPIDAAYTSFGAARVWVRHYTDIYLEPSAVKAEQNIVELGGALKKMEQAIVAEENRAIFARLYKHYADYAAGFKTVRKFIQEGLEAQRRMDALGEELRQSFLGYVERSEQDMDTIGPALQASNAQAEKALTAVGAVGVAAGVLFALFIILGLIKVLKELGAFAKAVADGNFSYQITAREKGEIGDMVENMKLIPEVLTHVTTQGRTLANDIAIGNFRARFDLKQFQGSFADLTGCINSVGDAYTAVLDAMPTAITSGDGACSLRFLNSAAQRALGGNAVGKACGDLFKTPACNERECFGRNALKSDKTASGDTYAVLGKEKIELTVNAVPLRNLAGKAEGFMEILTDVTQVRNAQTTMLQVAHEAMEIADRVAAASEELSAQVEEVSRGAEMQRDRVEATATAMNEMNSTVLEVARNAGHASEQSEETRKKADNGSELVNKVVQSINGVNTVALGLQDNMKGLGQQAESIGGVMNVISDIADQTNLLALNAAIEAARAGEAGRGFAVVADEVRKLAEKTMNATHEVGGNIQAIQNSARTNISEVTNAVKNIGEATELANASGRALQEIVELASSNSSVVASIATAAEEQSATSEEINHALDDVSRIVAETAGGMEQASSAVQDLAKTAQQLKSVMERLR